MPSIPLAVHDQAQEKGRMMTHRRSWTRLEGAPHDGMSVRLLSCISVPWPRPCFSCVISYWLVRRRTDACSSTLVSWFKGGREAISGLFGWGLAKTTGSSHAQHASAHRRIIHLSGRLIM
uniref:Uncharacterized protein n=1 Tax=Arundo donax TaxID=35708 RepID=A0A0A9DDG2_ARUDO